MQKAFDHFKKWMTPWCHLPLLICRLGGDSGPSFARSFRYVILRQPWINTPNEDEMRYADESHNDITNDFGLSELLLQDDYFHHEFEEFCTLENPLLHHYSHHYEFVKTRIYFIVTHQQQIEGLLNLI